MPPQLISGDITSKDPEEFRTSLKANDITRIDTAARYQNGESEKVIGRAKLPQDFTIDTKILISAPSEAFLSPKAIDKSLKNSLQVLGVEKVNVLYCHGPDYSTPIAEQAKAFNEHYKQGRFKYLGVSNFSPEMVQEWLDVAEKEGYVKPSVYQGQYNLLCRSHEEALFPLLRKNNMHYAAYSPLAGGFLLGNFTADGVQGGNRFALNTPFMSWYNHDSMHKAIKKLKVVSERTGLGLGELSLRWLRYHSELDDDDVMIMGGSKMSHYTSSLKMARQGSLPEDVAKELRALWDGVKKDGTSITDFQKMKI